MKRSSHFNYFTADKDPVEKRKNLFKTIWKWIKIVFYFLVFGLTMTGCIQSFVIKQSNYVGNGIEFYLNKNKIAPKVNTFQTATESKEISYNNGTKDVKDKIAFQNIVSNPNRTYLVTDENVLKQIQAQSIKQNGGKLGFQDYDNGIYTSSLSISESNGKFYQPEGVDNTQAIYNNGKGNYLFISQYAKSYDYVNQIIPIYMFNNITLGGNPISITPETNNDSKNPKPVYHNGVFWIKDFAPVIEIGTFKNIDNVFIKYQRDILQTFYNLTFGPGTEYYKVFGNQDVSTFIKNKLQEAQNNKNNSDYLFTLTPKQYAYLTNYQLLIKSFLTNPIINFASSIVQNKTVVGYNINTITPAYKERFAYYLQKAIEVANDPKNKDSNALNDLRNIINKANAVYANPNSFDANYNQSTFNILNNKLMSQYKGEWESSSKNSEALYQIGNVSPLNNPVNVPASGNNPQKAVTTWGESWGYGPFYGIFVYPLSLLVQAVRIGTGDLNGWGSIIAIIIAVIITRTITLAITFKSTVSQSAQDDLRIKKAAIENKYKGFEKNKQMKARKQKEISELYKKNNINPLDSFLPQLIAMPIFFAMWRSIVAIPEIKTTVWLGIDFSATSFRLLLAGQFIYLWPIIVVVIIQVVSQLLPRFLNKKRLKERTTLAEIQALKKSEKTQNIMIIVFTVIAVIFSAGIQVYWMFTGIWMIFQTILIHQLRKTQWFKSLYKRKKFV